MVLTIMMAMVITIEIRPAPGVSLECFLKFGDSLTNLPNVRRSLSLVKVNSYVLVVKLVVK